MKGRLLIAWVVTCAECGVHKIMPVGKYNPRDHLKAGEWSERMRLWYCPICKEKDSD